MVMVEMSIKNPGFRKMVEMEKDTLSVDTAYDLKRVKHLMEDDTLRGLYTN